MVGERPDLSTSPGTTYGYVLSATLFALGHVFPTGMPAHFTVAVIYAWGNRCWRTLSVPIVAHATNNSIAFAIAILAGS